MKADYGQIELRVAAEVAGETRMIEALKNGIDVHTETAKASLGKDEITDKERQIGKTLNFGISYGLGVGGLQKKWKALIGKDLSAKEAQTIINRFYKSYPAFRKRKDEVKQTKDKPTNTTTIGGRIRRGVTRYTDKLNSPIQGSAADGLKAAMGLMWQRRGELPDEAFPIAVVHDEVVFECLKNDAERVAEFVKEAMIDGMSLFLKQVPVEVDCKIGETWGG